MNKPISGSDGSGPFLEGWHKDVEAEKANAPKEAATRKRTQPLTIEQGKKGELFIRNSDDNSRFRIKTLHIPPHLTSTKELFGIEGPEKEEIYNRIIDYFDFSSVPLDKEVEEVTGDRIEIKVKKTDGSTKFYAVTDPGNFPAKHPLAGRITPLYFSSTGQIQLIVAIAERVLGVGGKDEDEDSDRESGKSSRRSSVSDASRRSSIASQSSEQAARDFQEIQDEIANGSAADKANRSGKVVLRPKQPAVVNPEIRLRRLDPEQDSE